VLGSVRVSRRHAVVRRTPEGVELVDVGSSNGTRLNGREIRARFPEPLHPGDRIQLADELALYDDSLEGLWRSELRQRLLTSIVKLHMALPQDETRKSFGREEIVPATTEARVDLDSGSVEIERSMPLEDGRGFPEGAGAFVGNVTLDAGTLELSLWALAGTESMTSRRASFSSLKHTTLRVSMKGQGESDTMDPSHGPWFPQQILASLFELFPYEEEFNPRFAHALAEQPRPVALRDAAESFALLYDRNAEDVEALVRAARLKGAYVDAEVDALGISLKLADKKRLTEALASARSWLAAAGQRGADDEDRQEAAAVIERAAERLERLSQ
jgi:hypothetical protein